MSIEPSDSLLALQRLASLREAIQLEESARLRALTEACGGQLSIAQKKACLERFMDRLASARASVYRSSAARASAAQIPRADSA